LANSRLGRFVADPARRFCHEAADASSKWATATRQEVFRNRGFGKEAVVVNR
jgi:hypothetical protein